MAAPDGGPVFPADFSGEWFDDRDGAHRFEFNGRSGMSLRDWFAGESLKGAADSICDNLSDADGDPDLTLTQAIQHAARHARAAYLLADAMLTERAKGGA